ncbi:carboxymuconolactone decarboxylase family protein [Pseudoalteromonas sp. MMG005]|uniref:carboxymuconolactone decarboxylase family protein n=1 Tax=Pseudoalteromonas sp. MMG005 TaxID=2822682 RepID=UPI001B3A7549|nr:carboxymuconolactone decarboxylase family protein [Pseudoalteromonas sp. MMG005]MBQ4844865.1 carboxymuconolactone decarboxylase family protein [Pseudoalteromonas sp. MMG005]
MVQFDIHTLDSAPQDSKSLLQDSINTFGMIPNLHGVMAESAPHLQAYQTLHTLFLQSAFTSDEKTVVWQTINVEHNCHYCVPAHSAIAKSMGVDDTLNQALRDHTALPNERLETLRTTVLQLVRNRGILSDNEQQQFFDAGYTQQHLLDILLGLAQKIMSNYVNHLAKTPVDKPFEAFI